MGHGEGHTQVMQAYYIPNHMNSFPLVNGNIQRGINSDSKVSCDLSSAYKEGSDDYKVFNDNSNRNQFMNELTKTFALQLLRSVDNVGKG